MLKKRGDNKLENEKIAVLLRGVIWEKAVRTERYFREIGQDYQIIGE